MFRSRRWVGIGSGVIENIYVRPGVWQGEAREEYVKNKANATRIASLKRGNNYIVCLFRSVVVLFYFIFSSYFLDSGFVAVADVFVGGALVAPTNVYIDSVH